MHLHLFVVTFKYRGTPQEIPQDFTCFKTVFRHIFGNNSIYLVHYLVPTPEITSKLLVVDLTWQVELQKSNRRR